MKTIPGLRKIQALTTLYVFLIAAALIAGMAGCGDGGGYNPPPSQNLEIRTWYDLDAVRDNLEGNHTLMNDLNSTTPGYEELASPAANGGQGWEPIGTSIPICSFHSLTGAFDGQGYEIHDLYINRPDEDHVGLFGIAYGYVVDGVIQNVGLVNVTVTGNNSVGALAADCHTVSNSYSTGNVTGNKWVGGLMGIGVNVSNSHFTGSVTGLEHVGGLLAYIGGGVPVSNSYATGSVTGVDKVGGLVGESSGGTVNNSYATGSVTGNNWVGGLVGWNDFATVSNSYSTGSVAGTTLVGGLVGQNVEGTVGNSFWDMETSGQSTSAGGTGKNTTEMRDIITFTGAGWNVTAVANSSTRDPIYIWNIVNNVTYPFLSWQSV